MHLSLFGVARAALRCLMVISSHDYDSLDDFDDDDDDAEEEEEEKGEVTAGRVEWVLEGPPGRVGRTGRGKVTVRPSERWTGFVTVTLCQCRGTDFSLACFLLVRSAASPQCRVIRSFELDSARLAEPSTKGDFRTVCMLVRRTTTTGNRNKAMASCSVFLG